MGVLEEEPKPFKGETLSEFRKRKQLWKVMRKIKYGQKVVL